MDGEIYSFHNEILIELFENDQHPIFTKVKSLFDELKDFLSRNKSPDYNFVYDQTIGFGELISTLIICEYLSKVDINNNWLFPLGKPPLGTSLHFILYKKLQDEGALERRYPCLPGHGRANGG